MAKNSISKISNAFSTGGGGVNFEQQIQAMFLLSLLIDGFCPAMNEQTKKVHFQAKHLGHDVDDLVVITYRNQSEGKMACQIKHSITATEKDKTFQEVICAAWNDFNKEDFDRDRDRISLVTAQISNKAQQSLASWNSEIITSVLSLASDLIDNNHADRAEALLYNWFYDVTLEVDGEHLEKRVADYCDKIPDTVQLIKLGRVVCENPNRSFLRVLYKDWYNHKFDWEEAELGRIVLSASEPYCLLITPQLWTYNNGYLLNPPESFISSSSVEQKKQIHDILFEGVDDTETVLAGGIIDYTHKEEIFGFMVSYFSIPGLPSKYAAYCYERNSRLLLQSRPDFSEQEHYNITLHHNGIESFQGSNIMCGFSKISLDEFHWHINITVNGMRLFNEGGQEIGRFEYYYGQRGNMGNRYISNQPLLQRWVVSKDAVSKARCIVGCPNNIKINHAFDSVIRKYED